MTTELQSSTERGQPNGYASLDALGKVPLDQIPPSILDDIVELQKALNVLRGKLK